MARYKTRPFEIEAVQVTGDNWDEVLEFAGSNVDIADPDDPFDDDPEAAGAVWDKLHSTWVLFYKDNYLIKGMKGEFYPCVEEVFNSKYEAVE